MLSGVDEYALGNCANNQENLENKGMSAVLSLISGGRLLAHRPDWRLRMHKLRRMYQVVGT